MLYIIETELQTIFRLIDHVTTIAHISAKWQAVKHFSHKTFQADDTLMKLHDMSFSSKCKQWNNVFLCVSCSWVRTPSIVPSCWMLATLRLWRMQNTTASSSAMWTWSPWTTAISTTATTSRDTLPSPWTSLASGEVMMLTVVSTSLAFT